MSITAVLNADFLDAFDHRFVQHWERYKMCVAVPIDEVPKLYSLAAYDYVKGCQEESAVCGIFTQIVVETSTLLCC
jgi:hypothetical protein